MSESRAMSVVVVAIGLMLAVVLLGPLFFEPRMMASADELSLGIGR